MRKMKRQPVHPGMVIKEDYLQPLAISITEMAAKLGVSRKTLSKIVNGRGAITPEMALRLARAFDTTPDLWMNLQKNHDLGQAAHESDSGQVVKPIPARVLHSC